MVKELIETETESVSVPTNGVLDVAVELAAGRYDLVIAELTTTGLPAALERFRASDPLLLMLGVGDSRAILYEGDVPPFDVSDRSLRDVLNEVRELAFALQVRRSK